MKMPWYAWLILFLFTLGIAYGSLKLWILFIKWCATQ